MREERESAEESQDSKRQRFWRWFSTVESTDARVVSVLAIVETFLAMGVFYWIAVNWGTTHLTVSACIAPFLLLRTPESTRRGHSAIQALEVVAQLPLTTFASMTNLYGWLMDFITESRGKYLFVLVPLVCSALILHSAAVFFFLLLLLLAIPGLACIVTYLVVIMSWHGVSPKKRQGSLGGSTVRFLHTFFTGFSRKPGKKFSSSLEHGTG